MALYGDDLNNNLSTSTVGETVYGGDGDDYIHATGINAIFGYGGNGNDTIGGGGNVSAEGGAGNDWINASASTSATTQYGGDGQDYIITGSGNDTIYGGNDPDGIYGGAGDDTIYGGEGADWQYIGLYWSPHFAGSAALGVDTTFYAGIYGGVGNDVLYGGGDRDGLYGGVGNDFLDGGSGNDVLQGEDGNDTIVTGNVGEGYILPGIPDYYGDHAYGGAGDDLVVANYTNRSLNLGADLWGDDGADSLYGGDNADALNGGTGNDFLYARGGNDELQGGTGNDNLLGGIGSDTFFGGTGADYFNLYYDINVGDTEYLKDFSGSGGDWVILPSYAQGSVHFSTSGSPAGWSYGYIVLTGGTYVFAAKTSVADLQSHTYYY